MFKITVAVLSFVIALANTSCRETKNETRPNANDSPVVNTAHLDRLYFPVTFPGGQKAAGIYIYSEAPDYHFVADDDEGFTCVDDVARAAQFYMRSENFKTDTALQNKVSMLIHFIIEMQSSNGYFYNFLTLDGKINTAGKTSVNDANWWSWRALHTLTEASPLIKNINQPLSLQIDSAIFKLIRNIKSDLAAVPQTKTTLAGIPIPQWLPSGSASDQAAIILLGLLNYCSVTKDDFMQEYIRTIANGIISMQVADSNSLPYGYFLSWENVWHAYGNDQAYALFKAGRFLNDSSYIQSALKEVSNFYPWLIKNGMKSSFTVAKRENSYVIIDEEIFAQIAYGIRPMIFASLEAFAVTQDKKYAAIAKQLTSWFFSNNVANEVMYDRSSGRCYDGIVSANKINKNSGAESTIEALLALQKMKAFNLLDSTVASHQNKKQ